MKETDIKILDVKIDFEDYKYRAPYKFGGQIVDKVTLLNVYVIVENRSRNSSTGFGSITLGNVWGWPGKTLTYDETLKAMKIQAKKIASIIGRNKEYGHPVELVFNMEKSWIAAGVAAAAELRLPEEMPKLCALIAASAFDAAVHDAYGKVLNKNVYDCYSKKYMNQDISVYLDKRFKGEYLDKYTSRKPKATIPLYHSVGAVDPLTKSDLKNPVKDGLPEILSEWIERDGLTNLKIKLNGDDLKWDVSRVVEIERITARVQEKLGVKRWVYSLDFNEKCENVDYLFDFLKYVKEKAPLALDRVQCIEQPTSRDLKSNMHNKVHKIAKIKPVVIDEALVDYESLLLAGELGYSGVALKACKGQSNALLMAAAAQKFKMFLCVQDLTCPGASFLHSVGIAARIPTVAGVEGNARQYLPPSAYKIWSDKYPETFMVKKGRINTGVLVNPGLGH